MNSPCYNCPYAPSQTGRLDAGAWREVQLLEARITALEKQIGYLKAEIAARQPAPRQAPKQEKAEYHV